jgi:RNA polymerase sigma factor (TIGR02999 family)
MTQAGDTVARLLGELQQGNQGALRELFPLVYEELRVLAGRQRRRWRGDLTLNTTALVHEAYLKLVRQQRIGASSRAHFFAVAAQAMRHVLCNYARDRKRQKRGGEIERRSRPELDAVPEVLTLTWEQAENLLALDAALDELAQEAPHLSEVVECRFYGGMTIEDTATALGSSAATVKRQWTLARAWLYRRLQGPPGS